MAGNAKIGSLHVALGIDSAQFEAGLKRAQSGLSGFGKVAATSFKVLAAASVAAGAALAIATKHAIDHADALSKASQKVGVTTEALSRLEWAAKLSDVSLETLAGGLGKLSKSMADVATGSKGPAATAFAALGISVTDAAGKLRDADDVFIDIADRFGRMEDGSTKTALAMGVFGRSGAELIPMLNSGRAGLQAMADESDRLGLTLTQGTGRAAEEFNDTLTRIGAVLQGVTNKVMQAALPALQSFAGTLASPEFAAAAQTLAVNVIGALDAITGAIVTVTNGLKSISDWMDGPGAKAADGATLSQLYPSAYGQAEGSLDKSLQGIAMGGMPNYDYYGGLAGSNGSLNVQKPDLAPFIADLGTLAAAGTAAKVAIDPFAARMEELSGVLTATVDPFSQMKTDLTDLKTMFDNDAISAEQFGTAVQKTVAGATASFASLAGEALGALSEIFEGNKELAVASAIVNGIGSVAKTLETYGVTPWGIAAASVAALTAAANVASILSTSSSSTSMPGTSTPSAAVSETATQDTGSTAYIEFRSSRGKGWSDADLEEIIAGLVSKQRDGYKLVVKGS